MATSRGSFLTAGSVTSSIPTQTFTQSALDSSDVRRILGDGTDPLAYSWQEEHTNLSNRRRKWIVLGSAIAVILIAIGVAVGIRVAVSRHGHGHSTNSSVGPEKSPENPSTSDNPSPSNFVKDPRLHQSFWGLAYTPQGIVPSNCAVSLLDIIQDVQLLSQLTKRVRLYGSECNESALVLEAIKQTKVDMTVWLGNSPNANDAGAAYTRQRDLIEDVIKTYGTDHIGGITVGNEFMLNYLNGNNATDPNATVGNRGAQLLLMNITDTANRIKAMNLAKHIPVGTSDASGFFNTQVLQGVEYGMATVHPWFAPVTINDAAGWTYNTFQTQNVQQAAALSNKPTMYVGETGWPTNWDVPSHINFGSATASAPNLQVFLDTFVCQANKNNTGYFFLELVDEPWKGAEPFWGLFNSDKTLKNVTIPNCTAP